MAPRWYDSDLTRTRHHLRKAGWRRRIRVRQLRSDEPEDRAEDSVAFASSFPGIFAKKVVTNALTSPPNISHNQATLSRVMFSATYICSRMSGSL